MGNMKYVVGYSPDARGRSALQLGVVLARSLGAELDVVYVIKPQSPRLAAPRSNFEDLLQKEISKKYEKLYLIEMDVEFRKLKRNNQLSIELLEDEESHLNRLQDIQNIAKQQIANMYNDEIISRATTIRRQSLHH